MRKVLHIIIAVMFVFSLCVNTAESRAESDMTSICFENTVRESDGDILITTHLLENPGIERVIYYIAYTADIELISSEAGVDFSGAVVTQKPVAEDGVICIEVNIPQCHEKTCGEFLKTRFSSLREMIKGQFIEFEISAICYGSDSDKYPQRAVDANDCIYVRGIIHVLLGDVNGDEIINTADAVIILHICSGTVLVDENMEYAADFNRDGRINTSDAVAILRFAVGA
ncbi:MAG: dockerin type I repeat-containing protein [Clostridia bacterium]|nr:dockerin type I repeat-containing protein [Clostridia bacterium]